MNRLWSTRPFSTDMGLLVIRIALAGLMMPHGYSKLIHFAERAERFPDPFGLGHPASLALTIFAEFFCSIFLLTGLFTRFALVPLIIAMATVVLVIHGDDPFGDKEHGLLFLIPYLGLFLTGPGSWSLDRMLKK